LGEGGVLAKWENKRSRGVGRGKKTKEKSRGRVRFSQAAARGKGKGGELKRPLRDSTRKSAEGAETKKMSRKKRRKKWGAAVVETKGRFQTTVDDRSRDRKKPCDCSKIRRNPKGSKGGTERRKWSFISVTKKKGVTKGVSKGGGRKMGLVEKDGQKPGRTGRTEKGREMARVI